MQCLTIKRIFQETTNITLTRGSQIMAKRLADQRCDKIAESDHHEGSLIKSVLKFSQQDNEQSKRRNDFANLLRFKLPANVFRNHVLSLLKYSALRTGDLKLQFKIMLKFWISTGIKCNCKRCQQVLLCFAKNILSRQSPRVVKIQQKDLSKC